MNFLEKIAIYALTLCICLSCANVNRRSPEAFSEVVYTPQHATGFEIRADEHGNTLIRVTRPWQGEALVEQTLAIFSSEAEAEGYEGQHIVGHAERVVCMSTSYIAMFDAIGRCEAVVGVSGKQYVMNEAVAGNPDVADVGYDSNLNYELLAMIAPDLVLMYGVTAENTAVTAKLREVGIPYLYLGDYTEQSPLGKAEWMVAIAEIAGCRSHGEELYGDVVERYEAVRESMAEVEHRPRVMLNTPYQDVWYMPSDDSYLVRLLEDGGAEYIYKGMNPTGGSRGISLEEAYNLVSEADIWLNVGQCSTLDELRASAPHFCTTDVVISGEVYNNNRRRTAAGGSDFWESAIVRPDVVLSDIAAIVTSNDTTLYYHHKLK